MSKAHSIDLSWISTQARNAKTVESFGITSVALANLIADLAQHLPEEDLAPIREKVVNVVQFLGEVSHLVTPEPTVLENLVTDPDANELMNAIQEDPVERMKAEEDAKIQHKKWALALDPSDLQGIPIPNAGAKPVPPPPPVIKNKVKPVQATPVTPPTPSKAVEDILKGMGAAGGVAAKLMGTPGVPQAVATSAVAQAVTPVKAPKAQQARESSRVKATQSKLAAPAASIPDPDPNTDLKTLPFVTQTLGQEAQSDYEAAMVLAELWRK
jgi:hypothetical protein